MHIRDYVEHLKSKPEQVRRRIALGSSVGITVVVFAGWLAALGASGTLALSAPADAQATTGLAAAAKETASGFSSLLGAAAAYQSGSAGAASLTIVDGSASSTLDQPSEDPHAGKTVIPF